MPAKTAVATAGPLPRATFVIRQDSTIVSANSTSETAEIASEAGQMRPNNDGRQHDPDKQSRRPIAGHDEGNETVGYARAGSHRGKSHQRQDPRGKVDHREADEDRQLAAEFS